MTHEVAPAIFVIHEVAAVRDAFSRFAKLHMTDIAGAWQLATAEQKHRVQNLLFEDGLLLRKSRDFEPH
jgi:hypothetical protein